MIYPPIRIKKLYPDAKIPVRGSAIASGLDVYVHRFGQLFNRWHTQIDSGMSINLDSLDRILIYTGLSMAVDPGYEVQIRPRSGNALNKGLTIVNTPGTLDADYRGELGIIIINLSHNVQTIKIGDKIAQIVIAPVILSEVLEVEDLDKTVRGEGGFGSTGV